MDDWDTDNFQPNEFTPVVPVTDKWDGEDEDEPVKESWEDEDEEKKENEKPVETKVKPKPKKKFADKEKIKQDDAENNIEEEMSPEERLRRQKESDLNLALETTFGGTHKSGTGIDAMNPSNKEEFSELSEAISKKLTLYTKSPDYSDFVEELVRNICVSMNSNDLRKLKTTVDNMVLEKQKIEKGDKTKKKGGKGKIKLKLDGPNAQYEDYGVYGGDFDDEFDDFM